MDKVLSRLPAILALCAILVSTGGYVFATRQNSKDIEELQARTVTRELVDVQIVDINRRLDRIERQQITEIEQQRQMLELMLKIAR